MAGKLSAMGTWLKAAGSRFAFFAASLVCGIVVPLSTLGAEAHVRGKIDAVSWFSAGVTYVAGIGLVSRTKLGLLFMLMAAAVLAFLYGEDMRDAADAPTNVWIAKCMILLASLMYAAERVGLHLADNRPFPE